jgi:hypothetical protein
MKLLVQEKIRSDYDFHMRYAYTSSIKNDNQRDIREANPHLAEPMLAQLKCQRISV